MSNCIDFRKSALDLRGQLTAAQSELAALREELDNTKRIAITEIEALSRTLRNQAKEMAAAEQRNASLISQLKHFASCADVRQVGTLAMDAVARLTKPTESGASECVPTKQS